MWTSILANLCVIHSFYQTAHWSMKGSGTYEYHLLFERLFLGVFPEIDEVAEKSLAITNSTRSIHYHSVMKIMNSLSSKIPEDLNSVKDFLREADRLEKDFVSLLNDILEKEKLSEGSKNMLANIADKHEQNLYLIRFQE
jgi:DNA-binding ferritin-like protein